jgi:hypothetical protein
MADPEFQPYRHSIEDLLTGSDYYVIPRFQRPYSWDSGNLDEFWRDTIEDNDIGYFIGPMVAWRSRPGQLAVVDGQQRLTTVTLLLAVLRDALNERGKARLGAGVHRYIERPDRDNEPRFVLQPEVTAPFLNNAILAARPDRTTAPLNDEERALQRAYTGLQNRVMEALRNDESRPADRVLRDIRDRVLGLRVIWVEHGREDDAYIVFETLNSRGKDLEVVDLLKNHLLNKLRRGRNRSVDPYRNRWNAMRTEIEESDAGIDINRFIQHWWLSQEAYVAQRKLFTDIKKLVTTGDKAEARLESLERDAPLYRTVFEPYNRPWAIEERKIPRSLEALSIFGVVQPAPLLLALLRARSSTVAPLKLPHLIRALQTIERFHFQFTAISQLSSSGGVSEMYAKYAREITHAADPAARLASLGRLRDALNQRKPDRDRFISSFIERLVLTDDITREKKLVQYVLQRLQEHTRPDTTTAGLTVEHVLPQTSIDPAGGLPAELIGSIGNLLLVTEDLNGRLGSKDLPAKQRLLRRVSSHYDVADILKASSWGAAEITLRARRLAELAYDVVWRLPVR